ncbi:MAG: OmpA family protein [Verrucomicrobiae bacterium]|nr:OmpA family protein [Verrucomicrobiae bacterium]
MGASLCRFDIGGKAMTRARPARGVEFLAGTAHYGSMKAWIITLCATLAILLGVGVWLYRDLQGLGAEAARLGAEAHRLGDEVKRLEGELSRSSNEISRLSAAVNSARAEEAAKARGEIDGLKGRIGELESRLADSEKRAGDLAARLADTEGKARVAEVGRADAERTALDDRRMAREVERRRTLQKAELERKLAQEKEDLQKRLAREKTDLERRLIEARKRAEVAIGQREDRIEVSVASRILFRSGSDRLLPEGMDILQELAKTAAGDDREIHVVGHSDDLPIRRQYRDRFPTNWDLAAARATAAARYLIEACKIPAGRLVVHSHGPTRPVAPNDTEEGRARNRRIEIAFVPAGSTAR